MKAGIVGAGALGSLFAHYLDEQLIDFVIYENNNETVNEISQNGLTLIKGSTTRTINPSISASPEILSEAEIIFIFVKSYSTEEAVKSISGHIKNNCIIVSLQNGLGNIEQIKNFIDPRAIVYGTTTMGAAKQSLSTVISGGPGIINIGGDDKSNVLKTHHVLNSAGLNSYIVENPDFYLWHKAVINSGINPLAAILNITNGEIRTNKFASMLQENIIRESVESAAANNIKMDFIEILNTARDVCEKTSVNRCSMLQDITSGRKTEIESINGKIIEFGESKGASLPCNRSLYLLIKAKEETALLQNASCR
jgi:2-dehydropantoate 2-reductase